MTVGANTSRVRFSFDGSLRLARELWSLADLIERTKHERAGDNDVARRRWLGDRHDEFLRRATTESGNMTRLAAQLRQEATIWAEAWRDAMNEQNRRNRAARVDEVRRERSFREQFVDFFVGDDSDQQVPGVTLVPAPQPPMFSPTGSEQFL